MYTNTTNITMYSTYYFIPDFEYRFNQARKEIDKAEDRKPMKQQMFKIN